MSFKFFEPTSLLKQITKNSLLIPYKQFYIRSHFYHKELIPEQNTGFIFISKYLKGSNILYLDIL
jgi:hypothetical protein